MMRSKLNFQAIVVRSIWKAIQKWMVWGVESLLLAVVPIQASVSFDYVELDASYFAYERDVGDVDGDGDNDVVTIQEGETAIQVFRAPNWTRSTLITFTGAYRYPRADDFKVADLDGDGDLDLVTGLGEFPTGNTVQAVWCENLGNGSNFSPHVIGNTLDYVKDIVVVDMDRDGRLDVGMRMDSQTQVWLQETNGGWAEVVLTHPAPEGLEAGDVDMDGDPDLILNGFWFATPNSRAAGMVKMYSPELLQNGASNMQFPSSSLVQVKGPIPSSITRFSIEIYANQDRFFQFFTLLKSIIIFSASFGFLKTNVQRLTASAPASK